MNFGIPQVLEVRDLKRTNKEDRGGTRDISGRPAIVKKPRTWALMQVVSVYGSSLLTHSISSVKQEERSSTENENGW